MWDRVRCHGDVMAIHQSVPMTSCERACRLYRDCVDFNMEWTQYASKTGGCSLMRSKTAYNSTNIGSHGTSFYGKYNALYYYNWYLYPIQLVNHVPMTRW